MDIWIQDFISDLKSYQGKDSFNPWADYQEGLDFSPHAPDIRCENLARYLKMRPSPRFILVGEALSFQGGRFSGIAMTSERQLLSDTGSFIFEGIKQRTSHPTATSKHTVSEKGFSENTGSIVWKTMASLIPAMDWMTWNIFPFHPYRVGEFLTNRLPREDETQMGLDFFKKHFMQFFPETTLVSVGKTSFHTLSTANFCPFLVRHPANGGAGLFLNQITGLVKGSRVKS